MSNLQAIFYRSFNIVCVVNSHAVLMNTSPAGRLRDKDDSQPGKDSSNIEICRNSGWKPLYYFLQYPNAIVTFPIACELDTGTPAGNGGRLFPPSSPVWKRM